MLRRLLLHFLPLITRRFSAVRQCRAVDCQPQVICDFGADTNNDAMNQYDRCNPVLQIAQKTFHAIAIPGDHKCAGANQRGHQKGDSMSTDIAGWPANRVGQGSYIDSDGTKGKPTEA